MRRFISSAGIAVSVAGIVVLLVSGQFTTNPHEPYYGSEHQHLMLVLLGMFLLCIIGCWIAIASECRDARRLQRPDSPAEPPAPAAPQFYDCGAREEAELPAFLSGDAARRLPGTACLQEWPINREPPRRIAQHERLRLI